MVVVVVVAHIEMSMYVETPMVMRDTSERHDLFGDARHDLEPWECGIASVLGAAFPRPGRRATEKVIHTGTRAAQLPSSTASFWGGVRGAYDVARASDATRRKVSDHITWHRAPLDRKQGVGIATTDCV